MCIRDSYYVIRVVIRNEISSWLNKSSGLFKILPDCINFSRISIWQRNCSGYPWSKIIKNICEPSSNTWIWYRVFLDKSTEIIWKTQVADTWSWLHWEHRSTEKNPSGRNAFHRERGTPGKIEPVICCTQGRDLTPVTSLHFYDNTFTCMASVYKTENHYNCSPKWK